MLVTAYNPTLEELEKTYLDKAIAAGTTTLNVKNASNFANNDRILIGEMGREKSEIVTVSATTDDTITTGATLYSHNADAPIYRLRYDQVKFYRSTTGSDGTYSLLSTVDMDVDQAELTTLYDDTTGVSTYYYKVAYYHSISTLESSQSDPVPGSGYLRGTAGFLIDEILIETGDTNEEYVKRSEIYGWLNEVNDDLQTNRSQPYSFLKARQAFTRTADTDYLAYPTDSNGKQTMWKFDRIDHQYVSGSTDITETLRVIPIEEFWYLYGDNNADTEDRTKHVALDDTVNLIRLGPTPATTYAAAYYLYYWKYFDEIDSESDEFETPTSRIYKVYCMMKFYRKKSVQDPAYRQIASDYQSDYTQEKYKLLGTNRKDKGTPRSFGPPKGITGLRGN